MPKVKLMRLSGLSSLYGGVLYALAAFLPAAIEAACNAMVTEGAIATDLRAWPIASLIFIGARDADFHDQAQRAAEESPNCEFISLVGLDH